MSNSGGNGTANNSNGTGGTSELSCGLIMPISSLDGCHADHWSEVKTIIVEAVDSIGIPRFRTRLVSDADESGVIQKRIVQNLYSSDIVVCDVSGKNPNVMFELGLRLAFDKPAVIVKDDQTDYSFDTAVIEHIPYPRDLRFASIVEFKKKLAGKVGGTYQASVDDPKHSPFLKSFGQFQVATLAQSEVSPDKMIIDMLAEVQREMQSLKRRVWEPEKASVPSPPPRARHFLQDLLSKQIVEWCKAKGVNPEEVLPNRDLFGQLMSYALHDLPLRGVSFEEFEAAVKTAIFCDSAQLNS
jgi:hypothetical protein